VNTVPLSVAHPRLVALATARGGAAIHENPKPSMGAGTVVSSPASWPAV
jgi:hypothetical protein